MASLGDMTVEVDLDTGRFTRNMNRMQSGLNGLSDRVNRGATSSFSGFNNVLGNVGGNLGGITALFKGGLAIGGAMALINGATASFRALGNAIKDTISEGVKYNASLEANTIAFEVMLGSSKKAKDMMEGIKKFADKTPFAMEDLIQSAKQMKAFGIETESIMGNLQMLGDIALGDSEKMKSLSLVFSQISTKGKLMGDDLMQLTNVGFNPLQLIAEKTGKKYKDLTDIMSKGGISAELVMDAFRSATSKGGQYFKGMDKLGQSFEGRMSTLADTMKNIKGELTKPFFEFLKSKVLPRVQKILEKVLKAIPVLFGAIGKFYNSEVKPMLKELEPAFRKLAKEFVETWETVKDAFLAIIPVLKVVWQTFKERFKLIIQNITNFLDVVNNVVQIIADSFTLLMQVITGDFKGAFKTNERMLNNFKDFNLAVWKTLGGVMKEFLMNGVTLFKAFGIDVGMVINNIYTVFAKVMNGIYDLWDDFATLMNDITGSTQVQGLMSKLGIDMSGFAIPKTQDRFNPYYDFASGLVEGYDELFKLNLKPLEDTATKMKDTMDFESTFDVDWASIFNKHLDNVSGDTENAMKRIKDAVSSMTDKIMSSAKAFSNFVDIFGKVQKVRISATSVFRRLEGQVREMRKWKDALLEIGKKVGEDSALFQELASKGPAAAGQIMAINRMSPEQLEQYKSLFGEKLSIGTQVAGVQQAGAMGLTSNQITINITDNNINDNMDLEIIANRMAKELVLAGVN